MRATAEERAKAVAILMREADDGTAISMRAAEAAVVDILKAMEAQGRHDAMAEVKTYAEKGSERAQKDTGMYDEYHPGREDAYEDVVDWAEEQMEG